MTSAKGVGIPVKLLHEAEGHVITVGSHKMEMRWGSLIISQLPLMQSTSVLQVELKTGETYRGELAEAEDSWNIQLQNVTATAKVSWGALA